jgi:hypothetical protein
MIDILFWIIGLSLFTLSFTWRFRKPALINAIGLLSAILFFYGVFMLFKNSLLSNTQVTFVLGFLPLNLLLLWFVSLMYVFSYKINADKIDEITSGAKMYGGLFLIGIFYIIGTLFFGYGEIQILQGILFIILSIIYFLSERQTGYVAYQIHSVLVVLITVTYYCLFCYLEYSMINLIKLSDAILSNVPVVLISVLFILKGYSKFGILKPTIRKKFVGILISLMAAGIVFHHPELKISNLPFFKDVVKLTIAGADSGIIGCSLAICLFKTPTIF